MKPTKQATTAKQAKPVKPTKQATTAKQAKPTKTAKQATTAKQAKPTKTAKPVKPTKPAWIAVFVAVVGPLLQDRARVSCPCRGAKVARPIRLGEVALV